MKIEKNGTTIEDTMSRLFVTDKIITCGCVSPMLKMTMRLDGVDFYQCNYACECGNQIAVVRKRRDEE